MRSTIEEFGRRIEARFASADRAPLHSAAPKPRASYSDRRKFNISCFCDVFKALKFPITVFASEPHVKTREKGVKSEPFSLKTSADCVVTQSDPELIWSWIACSKSLVRPSCKKNRRCPRPHSGAVRN